MKNDDKAAIFKFLAEVLKERGEPPNKIAALQDYLKETSANDSIEKLLTRTSGIVDRDFFNKYANHMIIQFETDHDKIIRLEEKIKTLENNKNTTRIDWCIVYSIGWIIALIASLTSLIKIFLG